MDGCLDGKLAPSKVDVRRAFLRMGLFIAEPGFSLQSQDIERHPAECLAILPATP